MVAPELDSAEGIEIGNVLIHAGDVDGRDVSVDGSKLDSVATNATKYPDTGEQAFLDADHTKLNGIAAAADVTGNNTPQAHQASHVTGSDKIVAYALGNDVFHNDSAAVSSSTSASMQKLKEFTIQGVTSSTTLRFGYSARHDGSDLCVVRLYKNGVAWGIARQGPSGLTTSYVAYTEDISGAVMGDLIQVYGSGSGGVHHSSVSNFKFLGDYTSVICNPFVV